MTSQCDACGSSIPLTEGSAIAMAPLGPDSDSSAITEFVCEDCRQRVEDVLEGSGDA